MASTTKSSPASSSAGGGEPAVERQGGSQSSWPPGAGETFTIGDAACIEASDGVSRTFSVLARGPNMYSARLRCPLASARQVRRRFSMFGESGLQCCTGFLNDRVLSVSTRKRRSKVRTSNWRADRSASSVPSDSQRLKAGCKERLARCSSCFSAASASGSAMVAHRLIDCRSHVHPLQRWTCYAEGHSECSSNRGHALRVGGRSHAAGKGVERQRQRASLCWSCGD
jgi:hypothetical protein